jgi:phosphocarrier protein
MVNRRGLHARAAAKFVQTASRYDADVSVAKDGQSVDGRSIMGLLMLAGVRGSTVQVTARGREAGAALDALEALVASGFGETD